MDIAKWEFPNIEDPNHHLQPQIDEQDQSATTVQSRKGHRLDDQDLIL